MRTSFDATWQTSRAFACEYIVPAKSISCAALKPFSTEKTGRRVPDRIKVVPSLRRITFQHSMATSEGVAAEGIHNKPAAQDYDRLFTVAEICALTHITRSTVYRYLAQGLRSYQREPRGARRFMFADVVSFLSRDQHTAPGSGSGAVP